MEVAKSNHDAQRTYVTKVYDAGMPLKQIQKLAGHEKISTKLSYLRRRADEDIEQYFTDDSALFEDKRKVRKK